MLALLYGVMAYAAFLGVFLYAVGFIGGFGVPRTIDGGGAVVERVWTSIGIDVALLAAFAVQHSVMARAGFKRWWTRYVPAPIERSTYVLLTSLLLALLFWQWRPLPAVVWEVDAAWGQLALRGLYAVGWAIVLASTFHIDHFDLFGLRQVVLHFRGRAYTPVPFQVVGLYRLCRHPLMLGFIVAIWATPRMTAGHVLFAACLTGYILVATRIEEKDLLRDHGEDYERYRRQVRMLVPLPRAGASASAR